MLVIFLDNVNLFNRQVFKSFYRYISYKIICTLNILFKKKVSLVEIQGCNTLRELREFSSWRKSNGNSGNFDLFLNSVKLMEVLIFSKKFREVLIF